MSLFSVIIPHYNSVKYLEELLATIPVEEDIQLIVVDDKSQENTETIERLVLDRGGVFLHNTTDKKGAGVCRNLGLEKATGKWLLFADADDYYVEDAFDRIRQYADSEADIIYFAPTSRYRDTGETASRHVNYERLVKSYLKNPSKENEMALRLKYVVPWSKMIRRELVETNGIRFDEVPAANDVMFSVKSGYYAKEILASAEQIYCSISSQGTLTTKHNEANFWGRVQVYKDRYCFVHEKLSTEECQLLGFHKLSGITVIWKALRQGYGFPMAFRVYKYFRENKVKLIDRKSLLSHLRNKVTGEK